MEEETMLLGRNAPSDSELSSYLGSENRLRILARASSTGGGLHARFDKGFLLKGYLNDPFNGIISRNFVPSFDAS